MPVGFLLFDENTKGFDDVWFVEEGEIKSVKGGTSVPVIVLGRDEKKVSLCSSERMVIWPETA